MTHARLIPPLLLLGVAGCSNPLASRDSDHGRQEPIDKLRQIDPLTMQPKPANPDKPPDPAAAAKARFQGVAEAPLTIEEARVSALAHNLDLKVSLLSPTIAKEGENSEAAKFEPVFTTRALWQNDDTPVASTLEGSQAETRSIEPGVRIPLRTGGTANVGLPIGRFETDNAFSTLNPSYTSDLDFSISQPLLRNAGREVATTSIRIAGYNRQISETEAKLAVINQLANVDRGYWRLYQARRNLEVTQQQYELAQAQLDKAQRMVNSGRSAEIEVTRAQSGVANRLDFIIRAQNTVLSQQRDLKRVVNLPGLEVDTAAMVIPKTEPAPVEYLVDAPTLSDAAIANRMEMLELELQLLADAANIKFNENQKLPALDLAATYNIGGLGASGQDSFHTLERNKFESWSIGANLEVPLGNEGAKARWRQSVLTRLQRLNSREARKLLIRQEVGDAVDRIQAGWQSILATRQATILSTRSLQAEQRQFDVGNSTSTNVLDAATRLAEAQLAEIQAVVDYELAQVDLAVATGNLLGAEHIRWEPSQPDVRTVPADAPRESGS